MRGYSDGWWCRCQRSNIGRLIRVRCSKRNALHLMVEMNRGGLGLPCFSPVVCGFCYTASIPHSIPEGP